MLHIIQNDPTVPPGLIEQILTIPFSVHHPYLGEQLPQLGDISALIVLGGTMGVNDDHIHPFLHDLKACIHDVVAAEIPYLGICLGGQLLAAVLGAQVWPECWGEMGSQQVALTAEGTSDLLFRGLPEIFTTFQWHNDSFDLPDHAVLLAGSPQCAHQAFRAGRAAWGLQFHPEVNEQIISDWCESDRMSSPKVSEMLNYFTAGAREYRCVAEKLLGNFLQTVELREKQSKVLTF